ncbi:hypothetical protein ACI797_15910 [Geodermatophilus sp. SYSU D00691]
MSALLPAAAAVLLVVATVAVLTAWGRHRTRQLPWFRCRLRATSGRRSHRWQLRSTRAAWVADVLVVRTGVLRLWLTPLAVQPDPDSERRALAPREVRGLGPRPVVLRLLVPGRGALDVAVAAVDAERVVGPFLTAALAGLPEAPRGRG